MSGQQRLINSKMTADGNIKGVVKALSGNTNEKASSIKKIPTKSVRGHNASRG